MAGCDEAQHSANLCAAHCQAGDQTTDAGHSPTVPANMPVEFLRRAHSVRDERTRPELEAFRSRQRHPSSARHPALLFPHLIFQTTRLPAPARA